MIVLQGRTRMKKNDKPIKRVGALDRFLMKGTVRDGANIASTVLLGLAFLLVGFSVAFSVAGIKVMYVVSDSMVPVFSSGDLVLASVEPRGVGVGDIVVYEAEWLDNQPVTHTVVKMEEDTITTRGANNEQDDPPFNRSEIVGEIAGIVPKMGFAFNPLFIVSLCVSSFVLIAAGSRGGKLAEVTPKRSSE